MSRAGRPPGRSTAPPRNGASDEKIAGIISNKLPPHLAGLGWIGKSCLLVTPEHGPRVRWVTVLTTPRSNRPGVSNGGAVRLLHAVRRCLPGACVHREDRLRRTSPARPRFDAAACERYFREIRNKKAARQSAGCASILPVRQERAG